MHSLINNNPMVDCIEEEYENYLLKSVINELNTSFDATKVSSLDLSPSSEFDDDYIYKMVRKFNIKYYVFF